MVGVSNFAKATRSIAMQADCSAWRRLTKDNVDSGAADRSEWLSTTMSFPSSLGTRRHFPTPSLTVFIFLQLLDILTTLLGLQLGAQESSMFLGRLMRAGPVAALLIAKIIAVLLVAVAMKFRRPRVVVFLNYWFAVVVSWNLGVLLLSQFSAHQRN
jgi:hypothetical protein